eukprot:TRINITY_DN5364_c0_g3_i1.p1 TRINITY_DN5364_c0_g3~~TRINITY_DN5364_c0_g3_i1.p1  ORF type:complete len:454 (-),score=77.23 TRINITY_DN5364_c0_g3_i1:51-1334(-)
MRCFPNVAMGLPSGGTGMRARDDWQGASWVFWSTGDLRIDPASLSIVFTPAGGNGLASKPLGCLTGAAVVVAEDGSSRSFVVTTNDAVHGLFRCNFQYHSDEDGFLQLAQAAEAASSARRATNMNGRRSSVMASSCREEMEHLVSTITEQHNGNAPIIFGGAELYGSDPYGDEGSEVLLGRGAVALLDPPAESGTVGTYELLFYEDGCPEPMFHVPIGPRMRLAEQSIDGGGALTSRRQSLARRATMARASMARPGVAAAFDLVLPGQSARALTFDTEADAAGFRRDFGVRQRLVALSLRTSRAATALDNLHEEFLQLQASGLFATLWRWSFQAILLLFVLVLVHAALLFYSDPYRGLQSALYEALGEARAWVGAIFSAGSAVGAGVCQLVTRTAPLGQVERCAALPYDVGEGAVRRCLNTLVRQVG